MSIDTTPRSTRRARARVHYIQSPLTRVALTLKRDVSHLILLEAGQAATRDLGGHRGAPFSDPRVVWRTGGADHELVAESGTRATIVSIPPLALTGALPTTPLGDQMRRTLGQDLSFPLDPASRIPRLVDGIAAERSRAEPGAEVAVSHFLSLVLVQLWRKARADIVAHGRAPQGLAERFILLAGQRLHEHLGVGGYAQILGVSRDRLGSAVRQATGHSPQAYIHLLLIREASDLLANTGMPVGQVAYRLGFSDPAYFSRFFTRLRGESPARFRRTAKARRAQGDQSYAAWP